MKHRWGNKVDFPLARKSERTCTNGCGITKVHRYETEGGREEHWPEFWRDGERIECERTPACDGSLAKPLAYDARSYPL